MSIHDDARHYGKLLKRKPRAVKPQAANPSPLPWVESDGTEIKDARGTLCAIASSFHLPHKEAIENRALIVRAVNAYAGLVEAASAIFADSETRHYLTDGSKSVSIRTELLRALQAALRAAGEAV